MIPSAPSLKLIGATAVASALLMLGSGLWIQTKRLDAASSRQATLLEENKTLRFKYGLLESQVDEQNKAILKWQASAAEQEIKADTYRRKAEAVRQKAEITLTMPPPVPLPGENYLDAILREVKK